MQFVPTAGPPDNPKQLPAEGDWSKAAALRLKTWSLEDFTEALGSSVGRCMHTRVLLQVRSSAISTQAGPSTQVGQAPSQLAATQAKHALATALSELPLEQMTGM
jgi:hypothetical protein